MEEFSFVGRTVKTVRLVLLCRKSDFATTEGERSSQRKQISNIEKVKNQTWKFFFLNTFFVANLSPWLPSAQRWQQKSAKKKKKIQWNRQTCLNLV